MEAKGVEVHYRDQLQSMANLQCKLSMSPRVPHFKSNKNSRTVSPQREEIDFCQGSHIGFSPSLIQQTGTSSAQNMSVEIKSFQMIQTGGQADQAQQFSGSSVSMQHQHGPMFQNQMGSGLMHSQHTTFSVPFCTSQAGPSSRCISFHPFVLLCAFPFSL